MDNKHLEQLTKVGELSDQELEQLQSDLLAVFDKLGEDLSDENLAEMDKVASAIMTVRETLSAREEDRATRANKAAELRSRVAPAEPDPAAAPPADAPAVPEPVAAAAPAPEPAPEPEPVVASTPAPAPSLSTLSARRPAGMTQTISNPLVTVTAAADVPGFSAGSRLDTPRDMGRGFAEKVHTLIGSRNLASRYPVATVQVEYPTDRQLTRLAVEGNTDKVQSAFEAITAAASRPDWEAITAAGGLCAPVEAHYGLMTVGDTSRPVRDFLEKFQAERGGIRYITPPQLSTIVATGLTGSAIGYVTEADDESGYPPALKPIQTITCGDEVTVVINAVTLRLKVGNFSRRTFPEQFDAWYKLALIAHAREAESRLLAGISSGSTAVVDGQNLGVTRDLLNSYGRYAAQFRSRHRTECDQVVDVLLPCWVVDAVVADIGMQAPGDGLEALAYTRARLEAAFRARGINVGWYMDGRAGAGQIYGTQAAGAGNPWLGTVEGYMFFPGTWMFIDGGSLDLGIEIRDSTLNSTNDVEAFMETFENVAKMGPESLRIRNTICVSGGSSLPIAFSCPTTSGGS